MDAACINFLMNCRAGEITSLKLCTCHLTILTRLIQPGRTDSSLFNKMTECTFAQSSIAFDSEANTARNVSLDITLPVTPPVIAKRRLPRPKFGPAQPDQPTILVAHSEPYKYIIRIIPNITWMTDPVKTSHLNGNQLFYANKLIKIAQTVTPSTLPEALTDGLHAAVPQPNPWTQLRWWLC